MKEIMMSSFLSLLLILATLATFELLMESALHGLTYKACQVYLDVIVSQIFWELLDNLQKV
jgi:hypothetical protein